MSSTFAFGLLVGVLGVLSYVPALSAAAAPYAVGTQSQGRRLHERRFRTIRHAVEFVRQQTERKADGGYARSIKI